MGIFPAQDLREAVRVGIIASDDTIPEESFQPASLDLRLGEVAHRLQCSFLPDRATVAEKLRQYSMGEVDIRDGAVLEQNRPYLIELLEEFKLPGDVRARANPRSSTGRLDIFTRVITDHSYQFDDIRHGYRGKLYLEVFSRSFTIRIQTGMALNQVRLMRGDVRSTDLELMDLHDQVPLLFYGSRPLSREEFAVSGGLFMSVDLTDTNSVGFKAKKNSHLLDLAKIAYYDPEDYWEPVRRERGDRLVLEPEEFYLLLSKESVRIPPRYAADMVAYDPTSGELRTHYAGFFDPGFGFSGDGRLNGARAVLEVRAHDVPFVIEDGQKVAKLAFERMAEEPNYLYGSAIGSSYQGQGLALSRQFKPLRERQGELL